MFPLSQTTGLLILIIFEQSPFDTCQSGRFQKSTVLLYFLNYLFAFKKIYHANTTKNIFLRSTVYQTVPLRQQRQHQLHPHIHANHRPLVPRRLANGIPFQRHLHTHLGKAHTSYIRLRPQSRPKFFRDEMTSNKLR